MSMTKTAEDAAMRERERCWAAWANADTLHLNVAPTAWKLYAIEETQL